MNLEKWQWNLRSRYNIELSEFIENSVFVKYLSQCWDISFGYVNWPDRSEFRVQVGLKGIGTVFGLEGGE